jgi:hypothetical protein
MAYLAYIYTGGLPLPYCVICEMVNLTLSYRYWDDRLPYEYKSLTPEENKRVKFLLTGAHF